MPSLQQLATDAVHVALVPVEARVGEEALAAAGHEADEDGRADAVVAVPVAGGARRVVKRARAAGGAALDRLVDRVARPLRPAAAAAAAAPAAAGRPLQRQRRASVVIGWPASAAAYTKRDSAEELSAITITC